MDSVGRIAGSCSLESHFFFFLFLFSSLFSVSIGYVATFIYPTTQVYHVSIRMVFSSRRELEVGSKPVCNGTYELSETPESRLGFLIYFVPFEPSDFGMEHLSELSSLSSFTGRLKGAWRGLFFDVG